MSKKLQDFTNSLFDNLENLELANPKDLKIDLQTKNEIKKIIQPQNLQKIQESISNKRNLKSTIDKKIQKKFDLTLFCDGASRGKPPGISSCGMVLFDKHFGVSNGQIDILEFELEPIWQKGQKIGIATNNIAEWKALILGVEYVLENFKNDLNQINLQILLDSNLVVQQLNKKWKVKDPTLKLLSQKAHKLAIQIPNISCVHIYRENNFLADQMANLALDE